MVPLILVLVAALLCECTALRSVNSGSFVPSGSKDSSPFSALTDFGPEKALRIFTATYSQAVMNNNNHTRMNHSLQTIRD